MSYTGVYVQDLSRKALFNALRARRTFAASDTIVVDFRLGTHWMGEEVVIREARVLAVKVKGTGDLRRVDIVRNGEFAYTTRPAGRSAEFRYRDSSLPPGEVYYYVRVIQKDQNMAWSSPVWVRRAQ